MHIYASENSRAILVHSSFTTISIPPSRGSRFCPNIAIFSPSPIFFLRHCSPRVFSLSQRRKQEFTPVSTFRSRNQRCPIEYTCGLICIIPPFHPNLTTNVMSIRVNRNKPTAYCSTATNPWAQIVLQVFFIRFYMAQYSL